MTSFKPPWLIAYAKAVIAVFGLFTVLYFCIGVFSLVHVTDPDLESDQIFTYAFIKTPSFLFGLSDDTRFVFEYLTEKEFNEKREALRLMAVEDRKKNIPKILGQSFGYSALFLLVVWVHWRLLRK